MADQDDKAKADGDAGSDSLAEFKEMLAEQRERQTRLRHVQQFLKSPTIVPSNGKLHSPGYAPPAS